MFCIKCGAKIPDEAKFCMNCGTAINYKNDVNGEEKHQENVDLTKESEEIRFEIVDGCAIRYDKALEQSMSLFGEFLERAYSEKDKLIDKYAECGSIEKVLQFIPDMAQTAIDDVLKGCLKVLYDSGINISGKRFVEKHYKIDYEPYYRDAVKQFAEINENKEALAAFRSAQKESRSRWQGGGFGVSGAVKGALTASVMNIGTDFIRSFGDSATSRKDNAQINAQLKQLYNDKNVKANLCWGVWWCIMHEYYALMEELDSNGVITAIRLDKRGADELFENTNNFADNREEYVHNIIRCITMYPGEARFYDAIMPELLSHEGDEFTKFLTCWHIEFLGDNYRKKRTEEQEKIEKQQKMLVQEKEENVRAQLFDTLFDSYKTAYEKENGKIINIVPNVYYKFVRPCLHDYCCQVGVYKERRLTSVLDYIPESSVYKKQLDEYLLEIRRLNCFGSFSGDEYIESIPKFIDIRIFLCFLYKVESMCLGEYDFPFHVDYLEGQYCYCEEKVPYHEDEYTRKGLQQCLNDAILIQQHFHEEKLFSEKMVLACMITEKYLAMQFSKGKYIVLELGKIKSIRKQGNRVYVSDGVREGYIEIMVKNSNAVEQFIDILYCMLRDYYGCSVELKFD